MPSSPTALAVFFLGVALAGVRPWSCRAAAAGWAVFGLVTMRGGCSLAVWVVGGGRRGAATAAPDQERLRYSVARANTCTSSWALPSSRLQSRHRRPRTFNLTWQ